MGLENNTHPGREPKSYRNRTTASGEQRKNRNFQGKTRNNENGNQERPKRKPYYGKDEDNISRRENKPRDTKPKEQPRDKSEVASRLEKEKKAMQKKQANKKTKHKQQVKPKRVNNIDWTREYENDSYDDDELDMYL